MSKVSFSYFGTKLIIVLITTVTLLIMGLVTIFGLQPNKPTEGIFGAVQYPAPLTSLSSGCGDFYTWAPEKGQFAVIPDEDRDKIDAIPTHPMTVPVFGYMNAEPLADSQIRFYGMDELDKPILMDKILRTMYDYNTIVVWYAADIAPDDYRIMQDYVESHDNILAVKWEYNNQPLPLERKIAISTWGISQSCEYWTDTTFESFVSFASEHHVARPEEPPVYDVPEHGRLMPLIPSTQN